MDWLKNTWNSIKSLFGGGAPLGSSGGGGWGSDSNNISQPGSTPPNPANLYDAAPTSTAQSSAYIPKRIPMYTKKRSDFYDEAGARSKASDQYNPYYDKLISEKEKELATEESRIKEDYDIGLRLENESLQRFANQLGVLKGRNVQDLQIELDNILAQRGEKRAETNYDRIRQNRALVSELAQSGMQFGGMAGMAGRETREGQKMARDQIKRVFTSAEDNARLQSSRGLEDIGFREEERRAESAAKKEMMDISKSRGLEDVEQRRERELYELNEKRKYAIEEAVDQAWQDAYNEWNADMNLYYNQFRTY